MAVVFINWRRAGIPEILQVVFIDFQYFQFLFCFCVTHIGYFPCSFDLAFYQIEVSHLQFEINDVNIPDRVNGTLNVWQTFIVKTTEDMDQGIGLLHIGKELVADAFALACPFGQSRDIHNLHRGRDDFGGTDQLINLV